MGKKLNKHDEIVLERDSLLSKIRNKNLKLAKDKLNNELKREIREEKKRRAEIEKIQKEADEEERTLKKEISIDLNISKKESEKQKELEKKKKKEVEIEEKKKVLEKEKKIDLEIFQKEMEEQKKTFFGKILGKEKQIDESISKREMKKQEELEKKEKNIDKKISRREMKKLRKAKMKQSHSEGKKNIEKKKKEPEIELSDKEKVMEKEKKIDMKFSKEDLKKEKVFAREETEDEKYLKKVIPECSKDIENLRAEISKMVIGQHNVIDGIIRGFLANGHVLIEGVPGIAKTLLIRTLANASGCQFSRIQFTVDLLPTDITGVTTYNEVKKNFVTLKGPIFSNFVIADEINRAPPKSQSALLEAMQERQVTIGKETHPLPTPFFVMANNNPLESSGTYPLPEAQIDRFLFKIKMGYTSTEEEELIIDKNITTSRFEDYDVKPVITPKKILKMQKITKKIGASPKIKKYVVKLVDATRKPKEYGIRLGKYLEWGGSPRATIGLIIAAKADALMHGKTYVTPQNVKNVAHDVLRHRLILNYLGQAETIKTDDIIEEILNKVPLP